MTGAPRAERVFNRGTAFKRHLGPEFYYTLALAIVATAVAGYFAITSSNAQIAVLSLGPVTFPVIYGFEAWRKWRKDQGNSRK